MAEKLPIKIALILAVLAILWWAWPASDDASLMEPDSNEVQTQPLVSTIKPIGDADAANPQVAQAARGLITPPAKDSSDYKKLDAQLLDSFGRANQLLAAGKKKEAITLLQNMIKEYPRLIEPHINLASLYANNGQLELASQTLEQAMQANPNTAALFASVQKVYGAKAAQAYALALNEQDIEPKRLQLPIIDSLDTTEAQVTAVENLRKQLAQVSQEKSELSAQNAMLVARSAEASSSTEANQVLLSEQKNSIKTLQEELAKSAREVASLRRSHQAELAELRAQLAEQKQLAQAAADREMSLAARAEEEAAAREQERLRAERLALAEQAERDRLAREANEQRARVAERERRAQEVAAQNAARAKAEREDAAVNLVRSWAASWSAQDVDRYVAHYADDYTPPGSSLNRNQWLEQRRVRLTNKKFIDVSVSEFLVRDLGSQFAITFTQHYRSNTVDDRIRKRLVFEKNGDDISKAKIVNERVISS